MGSNLQNGLHDFSGSESYRAATISKRDGSDIYNTHKHNNPKMAESIFEKILNIFGLSVYIIGIVANWFSNMNVGLSILLGVVGLVWASFRALKMKEDWLVRKIERRSMQRKEKETLERKNKFRGYK